MAFTIIVGALCALMVIGMPIAFAFLAVNIAGAYLFWGGVAGLNQMVLAVMDSVASFSIMPVPLFLLMGEVLFRAGLAARLMDVLDAWLGRIPGRLSLMAVAGGTLFATLAGSGAATTALLGRILVPDMVKRGYKQPMTLGPVMGSGGLAVMLPPSALGVILAATANLSVGEFLLAIIVPGLMMAASYAIYVVVRCKLQPDIAPVYGGGPKQPLGQKLRDTVVYVFPLATIIFVVTGLIFLGIATPTESAGLGALSALIMAKLYGKLDWPTLQQCLVSTLRTSIMILMILSGSSAFAQLLAFTGASAGLVDLATSTSFKSGDDRHHHAGRSAGTRHVHGIACHDPAVRTDLFSDHRGTPSVADLVRRRHAAQHGNGRDLAAIWLRSVRDEGGSAARHHDDGRLSRHHSIPAAELHRDADYDLLPPDGALAAVASGEIATVFRSPRNLTYRRRTQ